MRILFYINTIGRGGAQRVAVNLCSKLVNDNNEVTLVNTYLKDNEYVIDNKINRILLKESKSNAIINNISYIRQLRKLIKSIKPDVVMSFTGEPNIRNILATRGLKVKTLISIRNDPIREYFNPLYRFLAKTLFKKADKIVFQTQDAASFFSKKIQAKSKIIYNQVDEKFYNLELDEFRKDIITAGRLEKQKNHALLIQAFNEIKDSTDANLLIYGEGSLKEELENLIKSLNLENRVFLKGNILNIENELKKAKLFVLPSLYEGMPNALMEAMAASIPSISADCPCKGPYELLNDSPVRALFKNDDLDDLVTLLKEIINDEDKLTNLSKYVKIKADEFNSSCIYKKWKDYLEE